MKLFNPSELQAKPFNELKKGQAFYDIDSASWAIVFGMTRPDGHVRRFVAPLSGENALVPTTFVQDEDEIKTAFQFDLGGSFHVRFDSEPIPSHRVQPDSKPLLIMRDGPAIQTAVIRNPAVPMQRAGFLLNLLTFECDFTNEHPNEINDAVAIERWSLVFNAEPNRGTVLFQYPPQHKDLEEAA